MENCLENSLSVFNETDLLNIRKHFTVTRTDWTDIKNGAISTVERNFPVTMYLINLVLCD